MRLSSRVNAISPSPTVSLDARAKELARQGVVRPDETVVAFITGGGLKTLHAVQSQLPGSVRIEPTLRAFHQKVVPQPLAAAAGRR